MNELIDKNSTTVSKFLFTPGLQKSELVENLLNAFHDNGIIYCHWKSNEHLKASIMGDTDLDILFDERQKERLQEILKLYDFKLFQPADQRSYNDIEDYIGLDYSSGKIIHVHSHFGLTLGEDYLKSYQLNIADKVLESRVFDEEFNIYCSHPAFELILLFFRSSFKIRNRDKLAIFLNKRISYPKNVVKEFEWLKQRCNDDEVAEILKTIIDDYKPVHKIVVGKFDRRELLKLSGMLHQRYKKERLFSPLQALTTRWSRELTIKFLNKYSKYTSKPLVLKRINPRNGLVIAIIGADGSGKSTAIANLQSTFKKKLDVYRIYFGKGKGQVSWYRKLLVGTKSKMVTAKKKVDATPGKSSKDIAVMPAKKQGLAAKVFFCLEALMVSNEKLDNYRRMQQAKQKGMLVICDRFPQNQVFGYNDGPALQHLNASGNFLLRAFARKEARVYKMFDQNPPDIVFKMIAGADVVAARKPGEFSINKIKEKIEGIKQLKFSAHCKVVSVNAEEPLEQVLHTIRKNIWEAYQ